MLAVPDLMSAYQRGMLDDDGLKDVQPNMNAQQVKDWRVTTAGYDSKYAALYWPWIKIMDPLSGKPIHVPPGGAMAGIWARNDSTRGVHKAPANEVIRGAISLELNITKGEHDQLNPI